MAGARSRLAAAGPEVFYQGDIADKMVTYMAETGGLLTHEDLKNFAPVWLDPAPGALHFHMHTVHDGADELLATLIIGALTDG